MTTSPNLALAYLAAAQAQKETTHNEALNDLDGLVQLSALSRSLNAPPGSPSDGAVYIVGSSPTGDWAGQAGKIALYFSGWIFKTPKAGWIAYVQSESRFCAYTGAVWAALAAPYASGALSWTPGTLAAGAGATSSAIAVSGAAFGDFVAVAAPYDLQGVLAQASVSAAGSVVIRLQNQTGGSVTLGAGSWSVRLVKA